MKWHEYDRSQPTIAKPEPYRADHPFCPVRIRPRTPRFWMSLGPTSFRHFITPYSLFAFARERGRRPGATDPWRHSAKFTGEVGPRIGSNLSAPHVGVPIIRIFIASGQPCRTILRTICFNTWYPANGHTVDPSKRLGGSPPLVSIFLYRSQEARNFEISQLDLLFHAIPPSLMFIKHQSKCFGNLSRLPITRRAFEMEKLSNELGAAPIFG